MTKKAKVEQFDAVSAQMWRNYRGMEAIYSGRVLWSKWVSEPDFREAKYRVGVFEVDAADGGHCITVFQAPNQRPQLDVYGWDEFQAQIRNDQVHGTVYGAVMAACVADVRSKLYEQSKVVAA